MGWWKDFEKDVWAMEVCVGNDVVDLAKEKGIGSVVEGRTSAGPMH